MIKNKIVWKDINENYEVSNDGQVRSKERIARNRFGYRTVKERILKPQKIGDYLAVFLYDKEKKKQVWHYIHRLVAKAFVPNPCDYPIINHKDENPYNNVVWLNEDGTFNEEKSNLEWCTHQYNATYGTCRLRINSTKYGENYVPLTPEEKRYLARKRYVENKDKYRQYYELHKEERRAYQREYQKEYYKTHREEKREYLRNYYQKNKKNKI